MDVDKKYKFSYKGIDADKIVIGEFGNYIESDGAGSYSGRSLYFNSGTDILYTFMEENKNWKDGDNANDISMSREIQFILMGFFV